MPAVDHSRLIGFAASIGIAANSARMIFDAKYCARTIHRVYRHSDPQTEKARLRRAQLAAAAVLLISTYYAFKLFIFGR